MGDEACFRYALTGASLAINIVAAIGFFLSARAIAEPETTPTPA